MVIAMMLSHLTILICDSVLVPLWVQWDVWRGNNDDDEECGGGGGDVGGERLPLSGEQSQHDRNLDV